MKVYNEIPDDFQPKKTKDDIMKLADEIGVDFVLDESEQAESDTAKPAFVSGREIFADFKHDVLYGNPPPVWLSHADKDNPLNRFSMRPGLVTVLGGAPGAGKTAWIMQTCFNTCINTQLLNTEINMLFCNVEMRPSALLERSLAYYSSVPLHHIINRIRYDSTPEILQTGLNAIDQVVDRIGFVTPPYTIGNIQKADSVAKSQIVVIDYCQRVRLDDEKQGTSPRDRMNVIMDAARTMADSGKCVIIVSALSRQNGKGKDYNDAGLDAFRESSEIEYGADDAYILSFLPEKNKNETDYKNKRILRCVKKRYDLMQDIPLVFDGRHQCFTPDMDALEAANTNTPYDGRAAAAGERDDAYDEF